LETAAIDRVDRAERLVHQHQRRVCRQRPRHADPLALTARQLGRVARTDLVRVHPDQLQQLGDPRARPPAVPAEQLRDGPDVLVDSEVGEQPICWIT